MKGKQLYLFSFNKDEKKNSGRQRVVLPLDGIILFGIIAVLIFTLSFSLGVEKGKRLAKKRLKSQIVSVKEPAQLPPVKEAVSLEEALPEAPLPKEPETVESQAVDEPRVIYYIQVASFHKETTAYAEAKVLKEKGYPVSVTKKGEYAVVYVGNFEDEVEAKDNLNSLRKRYKDCILRKL